MLLDILTHKRVGREVQGLEKNNSKYDGIIRNLEVFLPCPTSQLKLTGAANCLR